MMAIGVASPRAQGHAMIRTATALRSASTSLGSGPQNAHATNAITAMTTTAGTK